jgi:hypothetical protein
MIMVTAHTSTSAHVSQRIVDKWTGRPLGGIVFSIDEGNDWETARQEAQNRLFESEERMRQADDRIRSRLRSTPR